MPLDLKLDTGDHFLDFGKDSRNTEFGPRYVKFSDKEKEHGLFWEGTYIGEWSTTTNKPLGRGILI
jgi:hypothetical protein